MATPRVDRRTWLRNITLSIVVLASTGILRSTPVHGQDPPAAPTPVPDAPASQGGAAEPAADQTDAQGGQVMTRGPVHEAFAAPVVHDPKASPPIEKQPPAPIRKSHPTRSQPARMSSGYPATGAGTSLAVTSSGSAESGVSHRPIVSGFPATGTMSKGATSGSREPGFRSSTAQSQSQQSYLPPPPASLEAGPNSPTASRQT